MSQLNNVAEPRGQALNCSLKQLFPLSPCTAAFRTFSKIPELPPMIPGSGVIVDTIGRDLNVTTPLPHHHKCVIYRDPCEPRRETGSLLKVLQVDESFYEGLLEHVLCILPILYDAIGPAQDLIGVAFAELNEGNGVPGLRS